MPEVVVQNNIQRSMPMHIPSKPSRNDLLHQQLTFIYSDADPGFLFKYCQEKPQGFSLESAIDELEGLLNVFVLL